MHFAKLFYILISIVLSSKFYYINIDSEFDNYYFSYYNFEQSVNKGELFLFKYFA